MRRLRWFVPVVFGLVLVSAAAADHDGSRAKPGTLAFGGGIGAALPYRGGVSVVRVSCHGVAGGRCVGSVRLFPRGDRTRGLVGSAALATSPVSLKTHRSTKVRLKLSQRARRALGNSTLAVTIELHQGKAVRGKKATNLGVARPITGDPKPDDVDTDHPPRGGGGTATVKTFSWRWHIPAAHYLLLPAFTCPSDAPNIATNGTEIAFLGKRPVGMKAKIDADASDGIGYKDGFWLNVAERHTDGWWYLFSKPYPNYRVATGWDSGSWSFNSVWAGLFDGGDFSLSVTCTDTVAPRTVAWVLDGVPDLIGTMDAPWQLLLPWVRGVN
jgi:hypothetical protein